MSIGIRLKDWREQHNLSAERVCEDLTAHTATHGPPPSPVTLYSWESGKGSSPRASFLAACATQYKHFDPLWILTGKRTPTERPKEEVIHKTVEAPEETIRGWLNRPLIDENGNLCPLGRAALLRVLRRELEAMPVTDLQEVL